jgi:hypothetical protein
VEVITVADEINDREVIGLASATMNNPNTSEKFSFWLTPGTIVNPFDIVEAEQVAHENQRSRTFGLVTDLEHITDAPSHLSNYISNDFGSVNANPNTVRQGTTVAKAAVLSNDSEVYMPVPCDLPVRFADEAGIRLALGITEMPQDFRVPAGLIEMSNGTRAVVYLDRRYVLGPEGAHVNISGISGLATKTSYAVFLITSIMQTPEASRIGVIILNVKHGDLLSIDQPPKKGLPPEQHELWEAMGLTPKPFEEVRYLLPHGKDTYRTGYPNSFRVPEGNWSIYAYSLRDTYDKLDLLLSQTPDPWDTIGALLGEITNGLSDKATGAWKPSGQWSRVQDWKTLLDGPPLYDPDKKAQQVGDVRASSVGRFRRILRRIVQTRQSGIFVDERAKHVRNLSEEIAKIKGGETIVVDIAKLTDDEQTLVFGDILRTIYGLYAEAGPEGEDTDLPEKVIIFVDELNKYAPTREKESPIIEQVLDIAERGRSLGVILIGAEQFMSAVHERVTGNAATMVVGRSGSAELAANAYRFLDPSIKMNLTRLSKGELLLSHAVFRQPVKIVFPKPAYRQEGT